MCIRDRYWVWHGDDEDGYWCDHGWWEFDLDHYSASLSADMEITPDEKNPTASGNSMKSGYGVNQVVTARVSSSQRSATTALQNAVSSVSYTHLLVDEDVGVTASIRIVNPQNMQKEDFVKGGTATGPMLDFLAACLRYGVSVCVAGATGSGKTTVAGWLLTTIPDNKRIFTIENGSRAVSYTHLDVYKRQSPVRGTSIHTGITREPRQGGRQLPSFFLGRNPMYSFTVSIIHP